MPSAFDRLASDDAAKFVDPTLFGVAATYTRAGYTASSTVNVTFDHPTVHQDNPAALDPHPAALARTEDIPDAGPGDRLVIDSISYFATEAVPDSHGHTWLRLTTDPERPLAPTTLADTWVGGNSIPLIWSLALADSGGPARTAVEVWRSADSGATWSLVTTLGAAVTLYTYVQAADAIHLFRVRGINAAGPGAWSNTLTVDTLP